MCFGATPRPVQMPPATVFDDVTNGYVPWSMSSIVPCAPSNITRLPARICSLISTVPFVMRGASTSP